MTAFQLFGRQILQILPKLSQGALTPPTLSAELVFQPAPFDRQNQVIRHWSPADHMQQDRQRRPAPPSVALATDTVKDGVSAPRRRRRSEWCHVPESPVRDRLNCALSRGAFGLSRVLRRRLRRWTRPAPIEFSPLAVRLPRRRSPIRRPAAGCRPRPRLRPQPCKKRPRSRPSARCRPSRRRLPR